MSTIALFRAVLKQHLGTAFFFLWKGVIGNG